jgi:hypothetical protein
MQGSVRTERRIAVSHNPNPDGGVNRLDDELVHELPGFGTIRIQVRVNEVSYVRLHLELLKADDDSGAYGATSQCVSIA